MLFLATPDLRSGRGYLEEVYSPKSQRCLLNVGCFYPTLQVSKDLLLKDLLNSGPKGLSRRQLGWGGGGHAVPDGSREHAGLAAVRAGRLLPGPSPRAFADGRLGLGAVLRNIAGPGVRPQVQRRRLAGHKRKKILDHSLRKRGGKEEG